MGNLNPSSELTLDFRQSFIPKTIGQFLGEVSRIGNVTEKVLQFDELVNRLETETQKIEAFKGELPLCMLLINDAIHALKDESTMLKKSSNPEPVLEEFIPMKNSCNHDSEIEIVKQNDNGDKRNWLSSTQLWNTNENVDQKANSVQEISLQKAEKEDAKNQKSGNGLLTEIHGNGRLDSYSKRKINGGTVRPPPPQQPTTRKQRRCWSTELHRRFLSALQELGGSQAATPKQILELMQVDGLTNDEVKSHLQKYRLHTRRLPSSNTNQIMGGGLWMHIQDQYVGSSKCSNSQSVSPNGPLPNCGNNMDDEDIKSENYRWNGNL
ncbi:hypothetical protein L1887_24902 [Cichorium endivia]|nr:hypothetical protein L1887_24902 [Cichorium endivia]